MRFWLKVIKTPEALLVNACDEELLEREFREGDVVLRTPRSFYGGKLVDEVELRAFLEEGDIISLVGEGVISVAVEMGIATWRAVKRVSGIPHLNIYRL